MGKSAGGLSPQEQKTLGGLGTLSMMSGAARHDPNVARALSSRSSPEMPAWAGGGRGKPALSDLGQSWQNLGAGPPQQYEPWSLDTDNLPMRVAENAQQMFGRTIGGLGQAPQNLQFQPGMTPNPQLGASPPGKGGGVGGGRR